MPSQMYYDSYVRMPEQFQGLCGFLPRRSSRTCTPTCSTCWSARETRSRSSPRRRTSCAGSAGTSSRR
eukprot:1424742-Prymnesium_polylepis.1